MLKFSSVMFAILAVAAAVSIEYLGNGIEYDVSPNVIPSVSYPYSYHDSFIGKPVVSLEANPTYATVTKPEEPKTELVATEVGLVATAVSFAIACVKKAVGFAIKNWSALILGSGIALGICRFTSLCTKGLSFIELQREIRSLATPQRIARATEFVESAIQKYNAMQ